MYISLFTSKPCLNYNFPTTFFFNFQNKLYQDCMLHTQPGDINIYIRKLFSLLIKFVIYDVNLLRKS